MVSDMLMIVAPSSTAHRSASTICSVKGFEVVAPKPTEMESSSASGATPIIPRPLPVPREAASEATQLP